jgi:predicted nucleic acid-binding protein
MWTKKEVDLAVKLRQDGLKYKAISDLHMPHHSAKSVSWKIGRSVYSPRQGVNVRVSVPRWVMEELSKRAEAESMSRASYIRTILQRKIEVALLHGE